MSSIHLIAVGKLKDRHLQAVEMDYAKRLNSLKLHIHEVKAQKENCDKEAKEVLKKLQDLSPCFPITLEEKGEQLSSPKFSQWLMEKVTQQSNPVFILGGAAGHGSDIFERSQFSFSLGKLTYPHQLARVLLVEQIYRAHCIHQGHPYHK